MTSPHAEAREDSCFIGCTARRLYRGTILSNLCKIPKQPVLHLRMTLIMENQTRLESWNNYCDDFVNHLRSSKAVLALLGAGLSASSGISTYQGSGSTWQGHLARDLATKSRFERDPVLVWEYYRHRQAEILSAVPNAGHFALAGLATMKPDFLTITQNVDELLVPIHGSLLDLHCTNTSCNYFHHHNSHDPHLHRQPPPPTPSCPLCTSLLRPSITRFGDPLPPSHLSTIESWFSAHPTSTLMLPSTSYQPHGQDSR
ncbi:DHS-like NAD/FAD-binding domain-containing protein [Aureobasidium pullulans]|uniref:DHS-like NAD/FAD-binding domain-containing protein n=1 Tax=Aureobasidium pullulans TaxID=5580 RepID=A0A4V6TKC3_AURPU|nr:DHS-like NAD/FAD-binding domain-containing protein [Aureobasidium pullulans]